MSEQEKRGESNGDYTTSYAIGAIIREMSAVRREMTEFQGEVRESFQQLGVRLKRRVARNQKRIDQLADEIEDTKTRDLRSFRRKYNFWKNAAISGTGLVFAGVVTALIAHYIFHAP